MKEIINSVSKFVFAAMAIAVIIALFLRIIDSKDFMILASMVFSYYFTRKNSSSVGSEGKDLG